MIARQRAEPADGTLYLIAVFCKRRRPSDPAEPVANERREFVPLHVADEHREIAQHRGLDEGIAARGFVELFKRSDK